MKRMENPDSEIGCKFERIEGPIPEEALGREKHPGFDSNLEKPAEQYRFDFLLVE